MLHWFWGTKSHDSVHSPQLLKRKESRSGIEPRSFCLPTKRLTARPNRLTFTARFWLATEVVYLQRCLIVCYLAEGTYVKLLPSRRTFCVHHATLHQFQRSLYSRPYSRRVHVCLAATCHLQVLTWHLQNCNLPPASCNLPPASCNLIPATCNLTPASCNLPPASCNLPPASCNLIPATCNLSPASCNLIPATCNLSPASCNLPPASCNLSPASYNLTHASCHLQHVTWHLQAITCHLQAVTCHLHFRQNDRDLLRATAVTRGTLCMARDVAAKRDVQHRE